MGRAALGLPDVTVRLRQPELMDEPLLEAERHWHALDALARVNRVSLTAGRVWDEVHALARSGARPVRVLDVACGGGDVLFDLSAKARRDRIDVDLVGCDVSAVALERARSRPPKGVPVRFEAVDVLRAGVPGRHDVVCSSLFLHHLDRSQAVTLLRAMAQATERVLLVQDLQRTRLGYAFAWVGLRLLTTSDVARADGPISVQAAYTLEEARELAADAGLSGADVRACWPERFALRWAKS